MIRICLFMEHWWCRFDFGCHSKRHEKRKTKMFHYLIFIWFNHMDWLNYLFIITSHLADDLLMVLFYGLWSCGVFVAPAADAPSCYILIRLIVRFPSGSTSNCELWCALARRTKHQSKDSSLFIDIQFSFVKINLLLMNRRRIGYEWTLPRYCRWQRIRYISVYCYCNSHSWWIMDFFPKIWKSHTQIILLKI